MNTKFKLLKTDKIEFNGHVLYRIQALKTFGDVRCEDIGGYVEKEENLSSDGNAWVFGTAKVFGDAKVYGNAQVSGDAWVYNNAKVYGNAQVYGDAWVYGTAKVFGDAKVYGNAQVSGDKSLVKSDKPIKVYGIVNFMKGGK